MSLDGSGETLTLARSYHIHVVASSEHVYRQALPFLYVGFLHTELAQVLQRRVVALDQMAALTAGQFFRGHFFKAQLHSSIAIVLRSADRGDKAWAGLNDGDGRNLAVRVKDLTHANFLTNNALHGTSGWDCFRAPFGRNRQAALRASSRFMHCFSANANGQILISMSTPAGRFSRINVSIVLLS